MCTLPAWPARPPTAPSGAQSSVTSTTSEEFEKATDYSFKEEDIEAAKALVGVWSPSNTQEFLTEATYDNMRNFARGYGDDNPLYTSDGLRRDDAVGLADRARR